MTFHPVQSHHVSFNPKLCPLAVFAMNFTFSNTYLARKSIGVIGMISFLGDPQGNI